MYNRLRRSGRGELFVILFLLVLSLVLHTLFTIHWDQLQLSAKPGDDDEGYIFLAYQILGLIPEPPLFLHRPPGWPLIIAVLLQIFGVQNIWTVLILHRLIVALFPLLVYIALRPVIRRSVALVAAVLMIFLYAAFWSIPRAYSEVVYFATGLLAMVGLIRGVAIRPIISWLWIWVAGLSLLMHGAVRQTGMTLAVGLAVMAAICARGGWKLRTRLFAVLILPTLLFAISLGFYHQRQTGVWRLVGPTTGLSLMHYGTAAGVEIPHTDEIRRINEALPEVKTSDLFATSGDYWIAQYRLARSTGDMFATYDLLNQTASQLFRSNVPHYARWVMRHAALWILDPFPMFVPQGWYASKPESMQARDYRPPLPTCNLQYGMGPIIDDTGCQINEQLRLASRWAPFQLPLVFEETHLARWRDVLRLVPKALSERWPPDRAIAAYIAVLTRLTVPYLSQLQRLSYLSLWGVFTLPALAMLIWHRPTRRTGLLLSIAILLEALPILLFIDPILPRLYRYLDVYRYLANWLAAGLAVTLVSPHFANIRHRWVATRSWPRRDA